MHNFATCIIFPMIIFNWRDITRSGFSTLYILTLINTEVNNYETIEKSDFRVHYESVFIRENTHTQNNGLSSNTVMDIAVNNDNTLWCVCGGDSTYLCKFYNDKWTSFPSPEGLQGEVRKIFIDHKGGVWLLVNNSARFDGTNWQVFSAVIYEGYVGGDVFEDSKGVLWFSTYSQGLQRYDGTNWSKVSNAILPNYYVTSIGEDATGGLWVSQPCDWTVSNVASCKGVWRQNETGWKNFSAQDGLASNLVTTMLCDKSGAMWFGCSPGVAGQAVAGVTRFDGTNWKTFPVNNDLSDPSINSIYAAKNGDIWFTTYNGVTRLKPDGSATRFQQSSKPALNTRVAISRVLAMSPGCLGKIGFPELYDISGRRVTSDWLDRNQFTKGVYIKVDKKAESGLLR